MIEKCPRGGESYTTFSGPGEYIYNYSGRTVGMQKKRRSGRGEKLRMKKIGKMGTAEGRRKPTAEEDENAEGKGGEEREREKKRHCEDLLRIRVRLILGRYRATF
jgi:hypothetical protein